MKSMRFLGQSGQAFDVFKLLIAAVVALAILGILFGILRNVMVGVQTEPQAKAIEFVKSSINSIGELKVTDTVTFSAGKSLNARTIAIETRQLAEDQVCVSGGDFADDESFKVVGQGIVVYSGKSDRTTKLAVVCDYGDRIEKTLTEDYGKDSSWLGECGCSGQEDRCCLVAIVRN
ncbi:MAG TPA: hypothetical protein HA252_05055 [Candidatus Diapherotrites archaeon]|uniref:Uncharacterized protein n=2 Tax=Candidatus Iainarchaeum sp. TaxID=3101447 RepID=A0A7J4JGC2_9ARCH|nr:hypothetical protein [Candidatus Diapherotrites archaeon]